MHPSSASPAAAQPAAAAAAAAAAAPGVPFILFVLVAVGSPSMSPQSSFQHEIRAALLNIARSKHVMTALKESVKMASKSMDHCLPIQIGSNVKVRGFVLSRRLSHSNQLVVSIAPMTALSSLVASTLRKDNAKGSLSAGNDTSYSSSLEEQRDNKLHQNSLYNNSLYNKYVVTLLSARYAWKNAIQSDNNSDSSYSIELSVNTRPTELAKLLKYVDVGTVVEVEGNVEYISEGMTPIANLQGAGQPPLGKRWFESRIDVQYFKYKKYSFQRRNRMDSKRSEATHDGDSNNVDEK